MDKDSAIFQPIKIGPLTVKNRVEVAPACPFLAAHDRGFSIELREYVRSLARSGAGIVNTGVTGCDPPDPSSPLGFRSMTASFLYGADLNEFAEVCHRYGAKASLELIHGKYMRSLPDVTANMPVDELKRVIRDYATAAGLAVSKGFDMICIHGGHGNVPSTFFSALHNKRTDEYGGSLYNRCRFGLELLDAVRAAIGGKAAISYRISAEEMLPGWTTLEETIEYCKIIQDKIDLLSVSRGLLESHELLPYLNAPPYFPRAMNLPFAKQIKAAIRTPVTVVNGMDLRLGNEAIERGDVDMASMVRTIYADTDCVNKARKGRYDEIRPCVRCNNCIGRTHSGGVSVRCAVNPLLGRETHFPPVRFADRRQKVVIVGGGPGGLEAARTASRLGHSVVLFEKDDVLGGDLIYAAAPEFKYDMRAYLDWSVRMVLQDANIDVRLGTAATPEMVSAEAPDAVIVAIGARPIVPAFSATGTSKLAWVGDVEMGRADTGDSVLIVGAGFTGLEAGLSLAQKDKKVKIIDMIPPEAVGRDGVEISMIGLREELDKAGVEIECNLRLIDVDEKGAIVESTVDSTAGSMLEPTLESTLGDESKTLAGGAGNALAGGAGKTLASSAGNTLAGGARKTLVADTVVLSLGVRADEEEALAFDDTCDEVMYIGDCVSSGSGASPYTTGGTLYNAVHTAFNAAMSLA